MIFLRAWKGLIIALLFTITSVLLHRYVTGRWWTRCLCSETAISSTFVAENHTS